jgi:hypothetical protein
LTEEVLLGSTLFIRRRYIGLLICVFVLTSLFGTGWYVRSSWIEKARNRAAKISQLKREVSVLKNENLWIKKDSDTRIAEKDEEICQVKQDYETQLCAKNEEIERLGYELVSRAQKNNAKVSRVRRFLQSRGSPMTSTAEELVMVAESYQIDPFLLVGIAGVESEFGRHCYSYNPFGYLQSGEGSSLRRYHSWVDGYVGICKFIRSNWSKGGKFIHSASQLKGYCCPDHPWMEKVDAISDSI